MAPANFPFSPAELDYLHTSLAAHPPIRPDLRAATDFRPLSAETGVLPVANGSAHVSFSDGGEVVVGVRGEVEKTKSGGAGFGAASGVEGEEDMMDTDRENERREDLRGKPEWITLTLTLPGARDDDAGVVFLEEMLREGLIAPSSTSTSAQSITDTLPINTRWHFHLYLDVVLISSGAGSGAGAGSYSLLPLVSMAIYLALCDTKIPMLKSVGEEDPVFEDDWERGVRLLRGSLRPPIMLLVVVVGENVIFDPSREELCVADAVVGVSVGISSSIPTLKNGKGKDDAAFKILALRTLDTAARDTMPGVPRDEGVDVSQGEKVEGVWRPKVGGVKRSTFGRIVAAVVGDGEKGAGSVAADVLKGLEGFLLVEKEGAKAGSSVKS